MHCCRKYRKKIFWGNTKNQVRNEVKELEGNWFSSMWRRSYYFRYQWEEGIIVFTATWWRSYNFLLAVSRRSCCFCTWVKKKLLLCTSGKKDLLFFSGNVILKILFSMQCEEEAIVFVAVRRRSYCFCSSEKKKLLFFQQWEEEAIVFVAARRRSYCFSSSEKKKLLFL